MKTYTILKVFHYSNFFPCICSIKDTNIFEGTFSFDDSCKYTIDEESCVNKLFGFCFGLFGIHKNSIRFGWTYNEPMNSIFIWSYYYKDGKLHKNKIFSCNINEKHNYKIELHRISSVLGNYTFRFLIDNNEVYGFQELNNLNNKCLLTLGPYFGGNTRAPHKMKIFKH